MAIDLTLLIRRACEKDPEAFGRLAERTTPLLRRHLRRKVDLDAVEDLMQETYKDAWKGMTGLRDPKAFKGWLIKLANGQVRQFRERRDRQRVALAQLSTTLEETYEVRFDSGWTDSVKHAVETLEPKTQKIVLMRCCEERSYEEIAATLDLNPATVRQRLSRGLEQLRGCLKSTGEAS